MRSRSAGAARSAAPLWDALQPGPAAEWPQRSAAGSPGGRPDGRGLPGIGHRAPRRGGCVRRCGDRGSIRGLASGCPAVAAPRFSRGNAAGCPAQPARRGARPARRAGGERPRGRRGGGYISGEPGRGRGGWQHRGKLRAGGGSERNGTAGPPRRGAPPGAESCCAPRGGLPRVTALPRQ